MLNNKFIKIYLLPCLFFAGVTSIVIFSWFRYGFLYGGGDVGLPSYDPARIFEITKNIWWEASAPGTTVPQGLTSVPLQFIQAILQAAGLSYVAIQAILFWLLLFLMGYGMFLVGLSAFGNQKIGLAILVGIFYMFNPYMMIQVWHRFIHNTFFLAAALPFFLIFFKSWIKNGRYFSLLLFLVTNFIAVYIYGTIAFIVTVFTLLIFICGFEILFPWKGLINSRLILLRFLIGIIAWLMIHSWWLLPVLNISPAILSSQHSVTDNLSTLLSISSQTIIPYSILGINPFYLYQEADFGKIFNTYFFRFLPWLSLVFLVPGFIVALKNKNWIFWALLAVVGVFLSKGATSPFGFPYIFGFSNFFPLGVLRNPFEKLGIFIPFAYAILIPLGIEWYLEKTRRKFKLISRVSIAVILFLILIVNLWPMWLGKMFGKYDELAFIQVPDSYIKADEYIKNQNTSGKILHLPLAVNESVQYNWKHGYVGVEPSQLLFASLPSISHGLNLGIVDDALTALAYVFNLPGSEDKILTLLQSFNIKFIVLHKDIQWRGGYLMEPQKLETRLDGLNFLEKKIQLGDLIIYELHDKYFIPKIKITNNISYLIPSEKNIYWPWLVSLINGDLLSSVTGNSTLLGNNAKEIIVFPEHVYKYDPQIIVKENLLGEMPAAKILPDSPFYPAVKLKEKIQYFILPVPNKFFFKVTLAGKRLTESYLLKEKGSTKSIVPILREYQKSLQELKEGVEARSNGNEGKEEISINFIISRHLATLNLIKEKAQDSEKKVINEIINGLTEFMKETNIIPYTQVINDGTLPFVSRLISRFNISVPGQYELLQANQQIQSIYPNNLSSNIFQINNEVKNLKGSPAGNFISYGLIDLPKGQSEISFNAIPSVNLAKFVTDSVKGNVKNSNGEIEIISGQHDSSYIEINIEPVLGGNWYQLTFDSWIKLGDKFKIQVDQDTDPYNSKNLRETIPSYDNDYGKNSYRNYWNDNVFNFFLNPITTKVTVRLMVLPWDSCKYHQQMKWLCTNQAFRYPYEQVSQVVFRNLKVVRLLTNPIFLRASKPEMPLDTSLGKVIFVQKNAVFYSGKVNLVSPGFFIFNETFHPGWQLELFNGKKTILTQKFLSNLYGNAWYIESPGDYTFRLEFKPQYKVTIGLIISGICGLIIITLTIRQKFGK